MNECSTAFILKPQVKRGSVPDANQNSTNDKASNQPLLPPASPVDQGDMPDTHKCPIQSPPPAARKHWIHRVLNWLRHYSGVISAGATIIAAVIYFSQLQAFIGATNDSAETQREMNMPLIVPTSSYINWNNTAEKNHPSIWVKQQSPNVGETRARGTVTSWGWGNKWPNPDIPYQVVDKTLEKTFWVKGDPRTQEFKMPLDEATRLATLKTPLFVYGKIVFFDLFADARETGRPQKKTHL